LRPNRSGEVIAMKKRNWRKGIAAVEFALVAPVFCTIILGTIELGRAIQVQNAMVNAVREGCRGYADNTVTLTSGSQTGTAAYAQSVVLDELSKANLGIDTTKVTVTTGQSTITVSGVSITQVTVTASVPYSSVSIFPPFFITRNLTATVAMRKA
jgi:Flp pilus assembly protein TadG